MIKVLKSVNWNVFIVLLAAGLLGVVAILPYMIDLLGSRIIGQASVSDIPLPLVVALALLQNGILLSATILIGMILSERVGLQMPLIRAWATGEHPQNAKAIVLTGMFVGAAVGVVLVGIEALFFLRHLPEAMLPLFGISLWKRLLASVLYGGITEELVMAFVSALIIRVALREMVEDFRGHAHACCLLGSDHPGRSSLRVGTSALDVDDHAVDASAGRARAGVERGSRCRVRLSVLEVRPGGSDVRTHERSPSDAGARRDVDQNHAVTTPK
jgi:hypothetical protein